jgi:Domain of unknown function DUF11
MNVAARPKVFVLLGLGLGACLLVVFASRGSAASGSICPPTGTPCINAMLFPGYVAVGSNGLAAAKFTNEGTATATHTVVSVQLPSGTSAAAVSSVPAADCSTSTVSCSFGNVKAGSLVKVFVQFTATAASSDPVTATAQVSFDEGNGNNGTPSNDTVVSAPSNGITLVDTGASTAVNGKCTGASSLDASTALQALSATYPAAAGDLPCTPVDTGIDLVNIVAGSNDRITFIDLPLLSGSGLATVLWDLVTLPQGSNVNSFVLHEIPGYPATIGDPSTWPAVQPCVAHAPPPGQDVCIDVRAKLGSKGIRLTLKVLGRSVDPGLWG